MWRDVFLTCGGEQPDGTRASHDADNKKQDHRRKECKNARGDACPKHTHTHTHTCAHTQAEVLQHGCASSLLIKTSV